MVYDPIVPIRADNTSSGYRPPDDTFVDAVFHCAVVEAGNAASLVNMGTHTLPHTAFYQTTVPAIGDGDNSAPSYDTARSVGIVGDMALINTIADSNAIYYKPHVLVRGIVI